MAQVLEIRVADNVLDDEDYGLRRLVVEDGAVIAVHDVKRGVYGVEGMPVIGATIADIEAWSAYDGTGTHPEQFHEVRAPGGRWASFWTAQGQVYDLPAD